MAEAVFIDVQLFLDFFFECNSSMKTKIGRKQTFLQRAFLQK